MQSDEQNPFISHKKAIVPKELFLRRVVQAVISERRKYELPTYTVYSAAYFALLTFVLEKAHYISRMEEIMIIANCSKTLSYETDTEVYKTAEDYSDFAHFIQMEISDIWKTEPVGSFLYLALHKIETDLCLYEELLLNQAYLDFAVRTTREVMKNFLMEISIY